MEAKNKLVWKFSGLLLGIVLIAVITCVVTMSLLEHDNKRFHQGDENHQWLHAQLNLNDEEDAKFHALEKDYKIKRLELEKLFYQEQEKLAKILRENDAFSPEVTQAIHNLHVVHGELQSLCIVHYYDMLAVLPDKKKDKLRALATDALSRPE